MWRLSKRRENTPITGAGALDKPDDDVAIGDGAYDGAAANAQWTDGQVEETRTAKWLQADHGLYFIPYELWISVWVDDFLIMARDKQLMQDFKLALSTKFEMQDLGPIHHFLGMEIMRDRTARTLSFTAKDKVDGILETNGMTEDAGVSTPLPAGCILERYKPGEEVLSSSYPYREVVGSLNFLVG